MILKGTTIFLPVGCSSGLLPYYYSLKTDQLSYDGVSVVAINFGIKSALFDHYLLRDTWLLSLGALFVLVCMWLYTGSFFLTIMTIKAVVLSLGVAYFMYALVFRLEFFPFMNLMTAIVVMGK